MSRGNGAGRRHDADVAIVGGGLAGLTMALQLKQARDELDIVVLERRRHPVSAAAHKVGESTVEIGAEYLAGTLGQREYLESHQLRKFGLRYFFGTGDGDLARSDELGTTQMLAIPSYQLDRGLLENHLAAEAARLGIRFRDGTHVDGIELADDAHRVSCRGDDGSAQIQARWLIDTASRASPLKKKLNLAEQNDHACFAVWFRVAERVAVDDWSDDSQWQQRCSGRQRWLSTNHMMGSGYWVWLIPLASGATSVGIVADPSLHSVDEMRDFAGAMGWLTKHQPRCAQALRDCEVLDYHFLRRYSHNCRQVFSDGRWALSGESGVFLDPYYSPGSDFIAMSNTLASDLLLREMAGEDIRIRSGSYQALYFSLYRNTLLLFQDQYGGFGDRHLMVLKTIWDFSYYWGIVACIFFNDALTDLDFVLGAQSELVRVQRIGRDIQARFRARAASAILLPSDGRFFDQSAIPVLLQLNDQLGRPAAPGELVRRIRQNVDILAELATLIVGLLESDGQGPASTRETELLGDLRSRLV